MKDGIVTVILPIYNVERYLDRCIKSVVNQTYGNLEIILVDDGSPDGCPKICEEWARKDNRIRVIHKKNAGLGMARNSGIDNATGEYICFVDSDDYIALNTVEKVYSLAKEKNVDIVSYGYCCVKKDGSTGKSYIPTPKKLFYEGRDILSYVLPNMIAPDTANGEVSNLWMSMCGALFSTELFQQANWRMVSERKIISEDVYSLLYLYKHVNKVAVIPEAFYFYCENMSSLTHTFKKDRFERIKYFYDACIDACNELGYSNKIKKRLGYPYLSNTIAALKMMVTSNLNNLEKKEAFKAIINDVHLQKVLKKMDIKKESITRMSLIRAMRMKNYSLCYIMIKVRA